MTDVDLDISDEEEATRSDFEKLKLESKGKAVEDSPSTSSSTTDVKKPIIVIVIGMAGSGKTTLMHRLVAHCHETGKRGYVVNLDPAVTNLPYGANIDIRDTVKYKNVMKEYGLGPNGGILTSLNLFATKFDEVVGLVEKRAPEVDYVLVDTPGQIEIFTWSASGAIITEAFASTFPTVVTYVVDTPRSTSPVTFMSNMLYACGILYKTRLPLMLAFNKTDVTQHEFAVEWMEDFEKFQDAVECDKSYNANLSRSLCLVLDEFYQNLHNVGVSAVTGAGIENFFQTVDSCGKEYMENYRKELDERRKKKEATEEERRKANLEKLERDLAESKGGSVVPPSARKKDAFHNDDDEVTDVKEEEEDYDSEADGDDDGDEDDEDEDESHHRY
ncbi:hypothetical protein R1sor_014039 [Riccia sorocarpa]|uniref:GPN-loop GTPase n=1 Tax=Riccia sorocarpa TaxID=122646 RepID=A0ABD3HBG4_9MARC